MRARTIKRDIDARVFNPAPDLRVSVEAGSLVDQWAGQDRAALTREVNRR